MKTFHILPKEAHIADCFKESHYIDLPDGRILLAGEFRDVSQESRFKAQAGVESLPHPLKNAPTGFKHAEHGIDGTETTFELSEKLKAVHPLMGI